MKLLPFLTGGLIPPTVPITGEPYHVSWNTPMMLNDEQYITPSPQPGWTFALHHTGLLTDYDELPHISPISTTLAVPVDTTTFGVPMILSNHTPFPSYPLLLGHIKNFADSDRRGKSPKVFQGRFACVQGFTDVDVFRYNLGPSDARFVAARITVNVNGFYALGLVVKLDPAGPTEYVSTPVEIMDGNLGRITESIRLVIYEDKIELRYDDPGTLIVSHTLTEPLISTQGANLMICRGNQFLSPGGILNMGIDGLYIYDGYF